MLTAQQSGSDPNFPEYHSCGKLRQPCVHTGKLLSPPEPVVDVRVPQSSERFAEIRAI